MRGYGGRVNPTDNEYDAAAYAFANALYADWCMAKRPAPTATCAGTRPVSGQCRTTAEEEPRAIPPAPSPVLTFAEATPMGGEVFVYESSTGPAAFSFRILAEDTPADVERKVREAVEKWKASE